MKILTIGAMSACLFLSAGALGAADKQAPEKQKAQPAPAAVVLPAGAVETAPGNYSYTDPQGKKWTYRQTPFGLARYEQRDASAGVAESEKKAAAALPPGAVETAPGAYSYTDPQGKKWTYRQTPFGMARFEEHDTSAAAAESEKKQAAATHAFEEGDSVRFERPGPFGVYKWKQKKTQLNSLEQTVWDRDRTRQPGAREKE